MIGITLRGRLGNQMFQYATAYALARRHGTLVDVDTSHYWHPRRAAEFELWRFSRLGLACLNAPSALIKGALKRTGLVRPAAATFASGGVSYDAAVVNLPDGSHLGGWFQSPGYFSDCTQDIRRLFDLAPFMPTAGVDYIEKLKRGGPVAAIHVRRGDYLLWDNFGVPLETYYKAAMQLLRDRGVGSFIVFSDDIGWCRQQKHFQEARVSFVDDMGLVGTLPLSEMALMAACDHNVICNSTFSWWAAWLGRQSDRVVTMPRQWLKDHTTDEAGLAVEGWIQL